MFESVGTRLGSCPGETNSASPHAHAWRFVAAAEPLAVRKRTDVGAFPLSESLGHATNSHSFEGHSWIKRVSFRHDLVRR
jgi:hypothetical protein